ncbi:MAG: hypothetical protein JXA83_12840 [Acidimicrobiales bacterium]|nr:hypothetical protein [Acidimicrobiales bacterium]
MEPRSADAAVPRDDAPVRARLGAVAHSAWPVRLTWLVLPLLAGPALGDALGDASRPVQVVASVGLWAAWLAVLVATMVPTTVSLTALRIAAPGAVAASLVALGATGATAAGVVGVVAALCAGLAALAPETAEVFVDGSSYGDERRLPLRVPAALLLGPAELAWAAVAAGVCAGPLLLAARQWVAGAVALAVGAAAAVWGVRVLHALARRWLVFVPAGVVVHDPLTLVEPVLLRRAVVRSFGPAPADTSAVDLTGGASGLALEALLTDPVSVVPVAPRRTPTELKDVTAVLVTPSRPGRVVAEARRRRIG